jgi:hypothetical protein
MGNKDRNRQRVTKEEINKLRKRKRNRERERERETDRQTEKQRTR